jgi:hypothetical protein
LKRFSCLVYLAIGNHHLISIGQIHRYTSFVRRNEECQQSLSLAMPLLIGTGQAVPENFGVSDYKFPQENQASIKLTQILISIH